MTWKTDAPLREQLSRLCASAVILLGLVIATGLAKEHEPDAPPAPVKAPDTLVGEMLVWVLEGLSGRVTNAETERFSPEFVEQLPGSLPDPKSTAVLRSIHESVFGSDEASLVSIENGATAHALRARISAQATGDQFLLQLSLDAESGLIIGLLITPAFDPNALPGSWAAVEDSVRALPGEVSVLVASVDGDDFKPVLGIEPDRRLGIGSAFKLWVLGALAEAVHEGEAAWDEPLALDFAIKTMPIGALRQEANREGMGEDPEFPLSRFADLMISISDNPATDHLIERIGRERVIEFMSRAHGNPSLNVPFLSTGQFFKLKRGTSDDALKAYINAGSPEARQAVLDSDDFRDAVISIPLALRWEQDGPVAIDSVEWFASATELARTMMELRRVERRPNMDALGHALRINDGINLDDQTWPRVAFKGGSEPGVLNLTYLSEDSNGNEWIVSLGWNNTEAMLDDNRLIRIAVGVFALLADGELPEDSSTGEDPATP